MERIWTTELHEHVGERIRLAGWLHRFRRLSNVSFMVLRDARGLAQVVIEEAALAERVAGWHNESVISVEGVVVSEAQAPGGVEVRSPQVALIAPAVEPPPFDLFRPQLQAHLPTLLDQAALSLRHARHRAIFELSSASIHGFRAALKSRGFVEIQTPKLVASATEGGANVFPVDYFGRRAYLAQSPQFYKQTMVGVFERVFETAPAFRAEPHDTPRHLNEFVSLDAEMGFIEDHTTVMAVLTEVVGGMLAGIVEEAARAVELLKLSLPQVPHDTLGPFRGGATADYRGNGRRPVPRA